MPPIVRRALSAAAVLVAGGVIWRLVSRRVHLPCPASLSFLVENRAMERVAGAALLLDRAGVEPGMRVLDAGCGPGRLTVPAARRVGPEGEVLAVDLQPEMLRRAAAKVEAAGLDNVRFLEASLGDGALPRGRYHRALLVTVLGEIPDRTAALAEIREALLPGGVLSVTEVLPDPHFHRASTVFRLGEAAGFEPAGRLGPAYAHTVNLRRPAG